MKAFLHEPLNHLEGNRMISENKQIFEKCHARPNQGTEYSYKINQQNMYFLFMNR